MKLKSSAIAVAVAGALGASMAAQADSGFYGSVRVGLQSTDKSSKSDQVSIKGFASRFGFRGETDMGNGLTGFGRYEFGVQTEGHNVFADDTLLPPDTNSKTDKTSNAISRRHAYVGLKGDWGSATLGQTYHTYYNFVVGPIDNPWWGANYAWLGYPGRTAQAATYAGDWGMFALGATIYMDGNSTGSDDSAQDLDKYELAASLQAGPIKLGLGLTDGAKDGGVNEEMLIGLTASGWQTGIFTWGLSYSQQDGDTTAPSEDMSSIVFDVLIGNGYVHVENTTVKNGNSAGVDYSPMSVTLGYTQSVGRQTTMWYEIQDYKGDDKSVTGEGDATYIRAVLKYDWK